MRSQTVFAVIPATPDKHLTMGFARKLGRGEINFAYSHGFSPTMDNTSLPNTSAPMAISHAQNNFVLDYRFGF